MRELGMEEGVFSRGGVRGSFGSKGRRYPSHGEDSW